MQNVLRYTKYAHALILLGDKQVSTLLLLAMFLLEKRLPQCHLLLSERFPVFGTHIPLLFLHHKSFLLGLLFVGGATVWI